MCTLKMLPKIEQGAFHSYVRLCICYSRCGSLCHVFVLDLYFSKISKEAYDRDNFYLKALSRSSLKPENLWFSCTPVGRNTLGNIVKSVCFEGQISGHKTNHSLRATGASTTFESGGPQKIIQQ